MASIPNNLNQAQQATRQQYLQYLQNNKQGWYKYATDESIPQLDPASIPEILINMPAQEGFDY